MKLKLLLLLCSVCQVTVGLAADFSFGNLTFDVYSEDDKTCYVAGFISPINPNLEIPSVAVDGDTEYTVISIEDNSFRNCNELVSLSIPSSVTSIGRAAFIDCSNLSSIIFSDNLTDIGEDSFLGCVSLQSIKFPDSLVSIQKGAVAACS